jgi:predicted GIY-YIG superfamily endonuclease
MTIKIYVLRLASDKWYVGKSHDVMARVEAHKAGAGSAWTAKYPPLEIEEITPGDDFDEDKITKKYMAKYGIDNVRGGSYVTIELTTVQKIHLQHEINMAEDRCALCGETGHFVKECSKNVITASNSGLIQCTRCGRNTHRIDTCYARTTYQGHIISDPHRYSVCERCGRNHSTTTCTATTTIFGRTLEAAVPQLVPQPEPTVVPSPAPCARCQGTEHTVGQCQSTTDSEGRKLLRVGRDYQCTRCGTRVYTISQCPCPIKGFTDWLNYMGDLFVQQ